VEQSQNYSNDAASAYLDRVSARVTAGMSDAEVLAVVDDELDATLHPAEAPAAVCADCGAPCTDEDFIPGYVQRYRCVMCVVRYAASMMG